METQLDKWQVHGEFSMSIMRVDINFTLPKNLDDMTRPYVLDRPATHKYRLQEIMRFLAKFKLPALNTFSKSSDGCGLETCRNSRAAETQIDYVFVTGSHTGQAQVDRNSKLESDHWRSIG